MQQIRPMKTVIGGVLAVADTVGRDFERRVVLDAIRGGAGALLTGDRRYGKTVLRRYGDDDRFASDLIRRAWLAFRR